jgi:hypothetical protein
VPGKSALRTATKLLRGTRPPDKESRKETEMKRTLTPAALPLTILAAGLALLAPGAARAAAPTAYTIQPIVKLGDKVADVTIKTASQGGDLEIGTLNDSGQLAFVTENAAGGEMLIQYANGKFTPIAVVGRDAPGGKWAAGSNGIPSPVTMNQRGDVVFSAWATIGGTTDRGTFLWDYQGQKLTLAAFKGMPAVNNLTFVDGSSGDSGSTPRPLVNNSDEIAFSANVKNAAGQTRSGVFFLGRDGQLQAIALPDQVLPGGAAVQDVYPTGITDNGIIAFVTASGWGSVPKGAYLWENGTITPIAVAGMEIPGLGKVVGANARVNNKDRSVVVGLQLNSTSTPVHIYRWADGQFTLLLAQGQEMPGGGKLESWFGPFALNDAGQFAFPATLQDGSTAAYLLDTDGTLSLILKKGASTDLGTITAVGPSSSSSPNSAGIGLNSKGQVVLPVKIGTGPATLVLLTPSAP